MYFLLLQHLMHFNNLHLHYFNYHSFIHTLEPDHAEQEYESPVEQAPIEDITNFFQSKRQAPVHLTLIP
jgi:hypothetical protein